jgi:hypothetical protein
MFAKQEKVSKEYMTWARTEYGRDWQFAYQSMMDNPGSIPRIIPRIDHEVKFSSTCVDTNKNLEGWV